MSANNVLEYCLGTGLEIGKSKFNNFANILNYIHFFDRRIEFHKLFSYYEPYDSLPTERHF